MGWIAQAYEGEVHVLPDFEPGHVLDPACWCQPFHADPDFPMLWTHPAESQRLEERVFYA